MLDVYTVVGEACWQPVVRTMLEQHRVDDATGARPIYRETPPSNQPQSTAEDWAVLARI